jgi:uncharacterized protein (DUF2126 family)
VDLDGHELTISRALEFWPVMGDLGAQEGRTARIVDSSAARIEVLLRSPPGAAGGLHSWRLDVAGHRAPLANADDPAGAVRVLGLRFRAFTPSPGLHPALPAQLPLSLLWSQPGRPDAVRVTLHGWIPAGGCYDGLPADSREAGRRRQERFVVESAAPPAGPPPPPPPPHSLSPFCLDLRRL